VASTSLRSSRARPNAPPRSTPTRTRTDGTAGPFAALETFASRRFTSSRATAHTDRDHGWHLAQCDRLVGADPTLFERTERVIVSLADEAQRASAVQWWLDRTNAGAEGCVVKPWTFVAHGEKGPIQPALKVRGREYLRIIYGPEYTLPDNLARLRNRGTSAKRTLAIREFSVGVEGLARLALESEPTDPRL
jgi:protein phosphatase